MKQRVSDYIDLNYAGKKRPDRRTIVALIKSGEMPGVKEGGLWYVYLSTSTGDSVADSILEEIGCA